MEREAAARRIKQLSEELEEHNHRYYVLAKPTISDREFDRLMLSNWRRHSPISRKRTAPRSG
jgi:NAD-dependent DNA ligase